LIVVTGAAGFIGSNLVRALAERGGTDLMVVDSLRPGEPIRHLEGLELPRRADKNEFLHLMATDDPRLDAVTAVLHQGACTDTTERDREFLTKNNLEYSKAVARFCQRRGVRLVYASSAAVYGVGTRFVEEPECEAPINEYARSKKDFDDWLRSEVLPTPRAQVVGLRYFNVYGPGESHKGAMASVAYKLYGQLRRTGKASLFQGSHGYGNGEQLRDFVYVDDVVAVNLWFLEQPGLSGIFNCGTGEPATFNAVAREVIAHAGFGEVEYVPFPEELRDRYQPWTRADLGQLRQAGFDGRFRPVTEGVPLYLSWLDACTGVASR
jgi:ADP-L-glycero-D-manno-heptose 6-epimerase